MSKAALDILDAQITDAEWERNRKQAKLLHDCKAKGFGRLKASGLITFPETNRAVTVSPEVFAKEASDLVKNEGWSLKAACEKYGRNDGDLRYYCRKFDIPLERKMEKRRTWDYVKVLAQAKRYINEKGFRMSEMAKKLNCSPSLICDVLKTHGYKYDAKAIKIRKVKTI